MTHEQTSLKSTAEALLQDETIQNRLRSIFGEIDEAYKELSLRMPKTKRERWKPSITPSGTYIEANLLGSIESGEGKDYLVFMFNLSDLKDPNFQLKPREVENAVVYRGSGIDLTFVQTDDPELSGQNQLHLPQVPTDSIRMGAGRSQGDNVAEPFKVVRQRAGVEL